MLRRPTLALALGRLDAPVDQGLSDELGKRVSIGRSLLVESLEHPKAIVLRAVLPELEFSFDPIDRHFEGDDGSYQLFVNVHREIFHAPWLPAGTLVSRNEVSKDGSREVAVFSCKRLSINVNGGIVPSRHGRTGRVPRRRDVRVRPVENGEGLSAAIKLPPMAVGSGDMANEDGFSADRRSMMGICEATRPDDDELVSVAKSYLSMNDSKIFSSEMANDPGTYIFLSARPRFGASNGRRPSGWGRRSESDPPEERSFYDDRP